MVLAMAPFVPVHDYCFAGYAKKDPRLFDFMNQLWLDHQLPTDFVYTAKMLYGIYALAGQGYFAPGSHVLCIHTGGLQGNLSLPEKTLTF
jgi:1-aminocyclopropane-1-carboxylate deaminase